MAVKHGRSRQERRQVVDVEVEVGVDPRRYAVFAASFAFFVIEAGLTKSFGVLLPSLVVAFDSNYAIIGVIMSLPYSAEYACTILVHLLNRRVDATKVAVAGGLVAGVALTASSFVRSTSSLATFFCLHGIGEGMILVSIPVRLHQHFGSNFSSAFSLVLIGSIVGITVMPLVTEVLLNSYGEKGSLFLLGAFSLNLFPAALVLKPPRPRHKLASPVEVALVEPKDISGHEDCIIAAKEALVKLGDSTAAVIHEEKASIIIHVQDGCVRSDVCTKKPLNDVIIASVENKNGCDHVYRTEKGTNSVPASAEDVFLTQREDFYMQDPDVTSEKIYAGITEVETCYSKTSVAIKKFFREVWLVFAFILPIDFLTTFVFLSWLMFMIPYALSVGHDQQSAVFIATMGGVGGAAVRFMSAVVLRARPTGCPWYFGLLASVTTLQLFVQPLGSSYTYLFACCFVIGGSLSGCNGLIEPMLSLVVRADLFPTSISILYFLKGVSAISACYLSGYLYDITGSFREVYFILGGLQALSVILVFALITVMRVRDRGHPHN